jgi:hypothetical protein
MAQQPKSHYLFLRIIAVVSQSKKPMTVTDIAAALEAHPDVIAHCIGLQLYLQRKRTTEMSIPPPPDYWAPAANDVITRELLEPKRAGRMLAVEKVLRTALGTAVVDTGALVRASDQR